MTWRRNLAYSNRPSADAASRLRDRIWRQFASGCPLFEKSVQLCLRRPISLRNRSFSVAVPIDTRRASDPMARIAMPLASKACTRVGASD
uniref:Uncharacterized protein n=1 Tax=Rhodococcus sp. NS1 TaxID=402236 RepID=A0A097SPM2_9NOCA|nr:hypothetical protein LRS1606.49 [Rhodococcus sp. NS1]